MEYKLTERQQQLVDFYLNEARKAPEAQKLSLFFNDNPNAQFFSVVARLKNGSEDEYDFQFIESNGHKLIKDINKGTNTKNCVIDPHFDTMIYGNKLSVKFGNCGVLTINNVVGLKVFADEQSLRNGQAMDTFELEHNLDKTPYDFAKEYYSELSKVVAGDEIHLDSKFKYDGVVLERIQNTARIELVQQGRKGSGIIVTVDLAENPFVEEDGELMFKAKSVKGENEETEFSLPVKNFSVDAKNKPKPTPKKKPEQPKERVGQDARKIMQAIMKDPLVKQAFYKQPSLMNYLLSAIKGTNPTGTGVGPATKIINKYRADKMIKSLGAVTNYFTPGKYLTFIPLDNVELVLDKNSKVNYEMNKTYRVKVLGDLEEEADINYMTLADEKTDTEILVKSYIKTKEDTFNVTFVKHYIEKATGQTKEKEVDGIIKIVSKLGTGYNNRLRHSGTKDGGDNRRTQDKNTK